MKAMPAENTPHSTMMRSSVWRTPFLCSTILLGTSNRI